MAFLKLKSADGAAHLVNVDEVAAITKVADKPDGSVVTFKGGFGNLEVKESLQTIANRLESVGYDVAKA